GKSCGLSGFLQQSERADTIVGLVHDEAHAVSYGPPGRGLVPPAGRNGERNAALWRCPGIHQGWLGKFQWSAVGTGEAILEGIRVPGFLQHDERFPRGRQWLGGRFTGPAAELFFAGYGAG